jgi:hypothetical protein
MATPSKAFHYALLRNYVDWNGDCGVRSAGARMSRMSGNGF